MHILLTNDDGIFSDGLRALHKELTQFAIVTVVAPDSERSSVSHAITLKQTLRFREIKESGKLFGYALSGMPADCVKFALGVLLKKKPDMVISGINHGNNDGCSVIYSGTVAGAREGALNNISSIATSLDSFSKADFTVSAKITATIAKSFASINVPKETFLNINVPNKELSEIKGIRVLRQGMDPIHGEFIKRKDPFLDDYYWMSAKDDKKRLDNSVDTTMLSKGYVTIVPIHSDMTDYVSLDKLKDWKVKL